MRLVKSTVVPELSLARRAALTFAGILVTQSALVAGVAVVLKVVC